MISDDLSDARWVTKRELAAGETRPLTDYDQRLFRTLQHANELLKAMRKKIDVVTEALSGGLTMAYVHGYNYTGPTFAAETKAIDAYLRAINEEGK